MGFIKSQNAITPELCAALGVQQERVSKVVIELSVDNPVQVYVEMYGTTEIVHVLPTLVTGAQVHVLDKEPVNEAVPV